VSFSIRDSKFRQPTRRIEHLTAGYAVREFRDDSQGRYWYVVTALEVIADQQALTYRAQAKISVASSIQGRLCRHAAQASRRPSPHRG
jgi:hypothetical protein